MNLKQVLKCCYNSSTDNVFGQINLFSECGQKYQNIVIIEFSSINCYTTSDLSWQQRKEEYCHKYSSFPDLCNSVHSCSQCWEACKGRQMRSKSCIQNPNALPFLWLIGPAKCLLFRVMESYSLHTIDFCKVKDKF